MIEELLNDDFSIDDIDNMSEICEQFLEEYYSLIEDEDSEFLLLTEMIDYYDINEIEEFKEFLNEYEELLELRKMDKMIAAGKLGVKSLRKLRHKKLIPTQHQFNRGLAKGTREILKKSNSREVTVKQTSEKIKNVMNKIGLKKHSQDAQDAVNTVFSGGNGYKTLQKIPILNKRPITMTPGKKEKHEYRSVHQILRRHEADEAATMAKHGLKKSITTTLMNQKNKHASLNILNRERKTTDYAKNAYGGKGTDKAIQDIESYRKITTVPKAGDNVSEYELQHSRKLRRKLNNNMKKEREKTLLGRIKKRLNKNRQHKKDIKNAHVNKIKQQEKGQRTIERNKQRDIERKEKQVADRKEALQKRKQQLDQKRKEG